MLYLPPNQGFSIYSLAALMPLLPAKQRILDPNDWMYSDSDVACPDPQLPLHVQDYAFRQAAFRAQRDHRDPATLDTRIIAAAMRIQVSDGYEISRIIKGGWHLAGDHGVIDRNRPCTTWPRSSRRE